MLLESGDLIPVKPSAVDIPWTRRKSQILNFLHRGPVEFSTLVYDSNVGDIAPLSTYFNPHHWTVEDLNFKFGMKPARFGPPRETSMRTSPANLNEGDDLKSKSIQPRLFIYPLEETPESFWGLSNSLTLSSAFTNLHSQKLFKPKGIKAGTSVNEKQPDSPDSPVRIQSFCGLFNDDTFCEIRKFELSPNENLEPIGPPKKRRMTNSIGDGPTATNIDWPNSKSLKIDQSLKPTYFSILSVGSPWSPWSAVGNTTKFGDDAVLLPSENQDLVTSLRKIASQSDALKEL